MPSRHTPFVLASGVEARLIEAEAALQAADAGWLNTLNTLPPTAPSTHNRTRRIRRRPTRCGTQEPQVCRDSRRSVIPGPRTPIELLFTERAFWLFITGHRQGDLRRLIRQYHRRQEDVYPTGFYEGGLSAYGTDVTEPILRWSA